MEQDNDAKHVGRGNKRRFVVCFYVLDGKVGNALTVQDLQPENSLQDAFLTLFMSIRCKHPQIKAEHHNFNVTDHT